MVSAGKSCLEMKYLTTRGTDDFVFTFPLSNYKWLFAYLALVSIAMSASPKQAAACVPTPPKPSAAQCTASQVSPSADSSKKRTRFCSDSEKMLLREVLSFESPFARGSTCWERISTNLSRNGKSFSARLCKEHSVDLVKAFIKEDNKDQRK